MLSMWCIEQYFHFQIECESSRMGTKLHRIHQASKEESMDFLSNIL